MVLSHELSSTMRKILKRIKQILDANMKFIRIGPCLSFQPDVASLFLMGLQSIVLFQHAGLVTYLQDKAQGSSHQDWTRLGFNGIDFHISSSEAHLGI